MLKTLPTAAGKRRTLVKIEIATTAAANASKERLPQFLSNFERRCELLMSSAREFQLAFQTVAMLYGVMRLAYDAKTAGISGRDRVKIGSRILNINGPAINEGGRNETVLLYLTEPEQP